MVARCPDRKAIAKLNDAQYELTQEYLNILKAHLGLKDWEIKLQREYPDARDAWAEIEVCEQHDTAWVRVAWPEFYDQRHSWEQRKDLVHELLHCHLDRPQRVLQRLKDMHPDLSSIDHAQRQHRVDIEFAVERWARTVAQWLPLPPEFPTTRGTHDASAKDVA